MKEISDGEVSLSKWIKSGDHRGIDLPLEREYKIFVRVSGAKERTWITLLHGFPTCSWDYAKVTPFLENHFRILAFDFLGFGHSEKPPHHSYSIQEQTDLTEAIWKRLGI